MLYVRGCPIDLPAIIVPPLESDLLNIVLPPKNWSSDNVS
jgi:hypothetical protein